MTNNNEVDNFKNNEFKQHCKDYTFVPFIYEKVERIVVLGDIHGDYKMAIKLLTMSGIARIVSSKISRISRMSHPKIYSKNPSKNPSKKYSKKYSKKSSKKYSKRSSKKSSKHKKMNLTRTEQIENLSISSESNESIGINDISTNNNYINSDTISDVEKEYVLEWIGGNTHVVQVGDQIDRCRPNGNFMCNQPETLKSEEDENSDIKILKLFTDLHEQAIKVGGAVISLLGNHELLNSLGEVQYVSFKGLRDFMKKYKVEGIDFEDGMEARKHAFQPGNEYGRFLGCTRNATVIIGSNLFVHAGIIDALAKQLDFKDYVDVQKVNILIKKWLLGLIKTNQVNDLVRSQDSMFWTRILGSIEPNKSITFDDCEQNISKVLKIFRIDKMIIGHTPQSFLFNENINGTCGNKIWRVDNGSSRAFDTFDKYLKQYGERHHNRRYQYLEILNDTEFHVWDEKGKIF